MASIKDFLKAIKDFSSQNSHLMQLMLLDLNYSQDLQSFKIIENTLTLKKKIIRKDNSIVFETITISISGNDLRFQKSIKYENPDFVLLPHSKQNLKSDFHDQLLKLAHAKSLPNYHHFSNDIEIKIHKSDSQTVYYYNKYSNITYLPFLSAEAATNILYVNYIETFTDGNIVEKTIEKINETRDPNSTNNYCTYNRALIKFKSMSNKYVLKTVKTKTKNYGNIKNDETTDLYENLDTSGKTFILGKKINDNYFNEPRYDYILKRNS